jgi:hypothetical protein
MPEVSSTAHRGPAAHVSEALLEAKIEGAIASVTCDVGVETIAAASLGISERRTIYTHPATRRDARSSWQSPEIQLSSALICRSRRTAERKLSA